MHEGCMKHMEQISEFLDDELDECACAEIRVHLQKCMQCRECVESLRKTVEVLKRLPRETIPADIKLRLRASLRECLDRGSE